MNPATPFVLLALVVGLVLGAGVTLLIVFAFRARASVRAEGSASVPDGVTAVLSGMDDAAIVVDASSTVRAASAPAVAFGLGAGAVLPADELRFLARRARTTGVPATASLRLRRGAGPAELRLAAVRAVAISPQLSLIVIRDITERERIEEMRRDFVANTSHELKTPVGAVSLLAEAIESAADDPDQVRIFSTRLMAEATRLGQLTTRIMSLSRLQASDELTDAREVSVDEIVASAIDANIIQADSAGVQVTRGGDRDLVVRGDSQVLGEALGNLISNAIAYSAAGSSVGVGIRDAEGFVDIAVTDRGIGIAEGDQERVFERFYRADQARSRRTGGTGLGLAIVKHAVQRHGGEVRLWSRPGHGSTFTIRLPLVAAPEDRAPEVRKKPRKKTAAGARRTNGDVA